MASGNRTSNQKGLLVFAILALIVGIVAIIGGLMTMAGGALIALDTNGGTVDGSSLTGTQMAGLAGAAGIIFAVSGIFALLEGIFGIRASSDATKATPFIVMATISLVLAILSMLASGSIQYGALSGVVINAVSVWFGVKVKGEANTI